MTTATIDHEEIELFRSNARKFLEKEVLPHYDRWEKDGILPRSLWSALGENGFLRLLGLSRGSESPAISRKAASNWAERLVSMA